MVEAGLFTVFETSLPAQDLMVFAEYRAARLLNVVTPPALGVVGWLGNFMVVHVLACTSLRRSACFPYLAAIACLDSGVLLCNFLFNFVDVFVQPIRTSHAACKLHYFLFFVCSHLSAWLLVAVTAQRYLVVCRPLRAFGVTSLRCTCWVMGVLGAGCVALNAHHLVVRVHVWNNSTGHYTCQTSSKRSEVFALVYWPWVDALAYCFVPSLLLVVLNAAIVRALHRAAAFRRTYQPSFSNHQPLVDSRRVPRRNSLPACFPGIPCSQHSRQPTFTSTAPVFTSVVCKDAREITFDCRQTGSYRAICETAETSARPGSDHNFLRASCSQGNARASQRRLAYNLSLAAWRGDTRHKEGAEVSTENVTSGREPRLQERKMESASLSHLCHAAEVCESRTGGENSHRQIPDQTSAPEEGRRVPKEHHVTLMPLLASVVFVMLSLPIAVMLIVEQVAWTRSGAHEVAVYALVRVVVGTLMLTNHAINFALYCFAGSTFRQQWRLLYCRALKARTRATVRTRLAAAVYVNGHINSEATDCCQAERDGHACALSRPPPPQQQGGGSGNAAAHVSQLHHNFSFPKCVKDTGYDAYRLHVTPRSDAAVGLQKRNSVA